MISMTHPLAQASGERLCGYCLQVGINSGFKEDELLSQHIETAHHYPIPRPGETDEEAKRRFFMEHPEANDPATCKCDECKFKRGELDEFLGIPGSSIMSTSMPDIVAPSLPTIIMHSVPMVTIFQLPDSYLKRI